MSSPVEQPGMGRAPESPHRPGQRRLALSTALLAGVAALVAFLSISVAAPADSGASPLIGQPAPEFELQTLEGGRLSLAELRGSPVVVNFWASWCIPCHREAPLLRAADVRYRAQGVRIVGIVYQDSVEKARDFMARYGQTYPGLVDPGGRTAIDYGVFGIPETYFIDASGSVRGRHVGEISEDVLERQIEALLVAAETGP